MIELYTGVPGSGKTLSMVTRLAELFKRWEKHPEESRPVFVHNIPHLAFPVAQVPFKLAQLAEKQAPILVPDWSAMPDGSLVIIDEAQGKIEIETGEIKYHLFPPRGATAKTPAHVAWLNTHRHHGFDIWLGTQLPRLIDASVRALVGRHMHMRRLLGMARSMCYEWDSCNDSIANFKGAVKSLFNFPRDSFKFYKSAEIHTKQKFRLPAFLLVPVVAVVMGVVFIPQGFGILHSGMTGQGLRLGSGQESDKLFQNPESAVMVADVVPASSVAAIQPGIEPDTPKLKPDSCIASETQCACYLHAVRLEMDYSECRQHLERSTVVAAL